jgi:hypothetical protein
VAFLVAALPVRPPPLLRYHHHTFCGTRSNSCDHVDVLGDQSSGSDLCCQIVSSGAADLASGASRRITPRHRSPGASPVREEPAPPEPFRLRPTRQLGAHRTRRLTTAQDRRFVQVFGLVPWTTRTGSASQSVAAPAPARSDSYENEGEALSDHAGEADRLGPGRLGSSNASASTGQPVSSPALAQKLPTRDGRNYRTDHWVCRS